MSVMKKSPEPAQASRQNGVSLADLTRGESRISQNLTRDTPLLADAQHREYRRAS
jgi:hypothetical protein